jgi:hypothetical protein
MMYNIIAGMLQRCQPRPLAVVKARSQQMYQRQHQSLHRLSQRGSLASSDHHPLGIVDEVSSPLTGPAINTPLAPVAELTTPTPLNSSTPGQPSTNEPKTDAPSGAKVAAPAPEMRDNGFAEDVIANPSSADSFEFFYRCVLHNIQNMILGIVC